MLDVQQYASAWDKAASLVLEANPALKLIPHLQGSAGQNDKFCLKFVTLSAAEWVY